MSCRTDPKGQAQSYKGWGMERCYSKIYFDTNVILPPPSHQVDDNQGLPARTVREADGPTVDNTWEEHGDRSSVLRDCPTQTQACCLPSASTQQHPILRSAQGERPAPWHTGRQRLSGKEALRRGENGHSWEMTRPHICGPKPQLLLPLLTAPRGTGSAGRKCQQVPSRGCRTRNTDPCTSKYCQPQALSPSVNPARNTPGRALRAPRAPSSAFSLLPPLGEGGRSTLGNLEPREAWNGEA